MIAYSTIGTNNMDDARKFYGELLGELGAKELLVRPDGGFVAFGTAPDQAMFAIAKPFDGSSAAPGNGNMVAIACKNPSHVSEMYNKAVALGARCDGEPGPRADGMVSCAYVRDADGNKLNFFCMGS